MFNVLIMENLGAILMTAGFLFVVTSVFIPLKKFQADEGDEFAIPEWD